MTLLQYSQTLFLRDIQSLEFKFPDRYQTLDYTIPYITPNTRFFDRTDFENYLSKNQIQFKEYFCICIFTMVCADETMHKYFRENYETFNLITRCPKFGTLGFGILFDEPCFLLTAPKEIDFDSIPKLEIKDFIHYQFDISSQFLGDISPNKFFTAMINDIHFNCECEIFRKILFYIKSEL
jgi:hypothetical protein